MSPSESPASSAPTDPHPDAADYICLDVPPDDDFILPAAHQIQLSVPTSPPSKQCDIGANISVTSELALLQDYTVLPVPLDLNSANSSEDAMLCPGYGTFPFRLDDNTIVPIKMYYCPQVSTTLLSPQKICAGSNIFDSFDILCRDPSDPYVRFYSPSGLYTRRASLLRHNDLFFFSYLYVAPQAQVNSLSKVLTSELWHQRLGHPGMEQLRQLSHCADGLPDNLHKCEHPHRYCSVCADAHAQRPPRGPTVSTATLKAGSRFHVDFGFMRASSESYLKKKGLPRIVESFDGYNSYLLITDAKTRYTWVFLTKSKAPPVDIITEHLKRFGLHSDEYRAIRVDQGGELYGSKDFCEAVLKAGYIIEPTGSGLHHQNGKVERLNLTYGIMVRSLLYSAGLSPIYWSAALLHAVYLKNRLWHSTLKVTPYEALNGYRPNLHHLRIFGSLLTERVPADKRAAKLDHHTYSGIFLGFQGDGRTIRYIDVKSGVVKLGGTWSFDEAHYMSSVRPPAAQLLFDLGLQSISPSTDLAASNPVAPVALMPPLPSDGPSKLPSDALILPLPLAESITMAAFPPVATVAAVVHQPSELDSSSIRDIMMLEFTDDPFAPSFDEIIPVSGDHPSLGLVLQPDPDRGRLCLRDMTPGTPAHRTHHWRSRLRHAHLLAINGVPVHTLDDVHKIVASARQSSTPNCQFRFAFDEVRNGLTSVGLLQLYFDQWRDIRNLRQQAARDACPSHQVNKLTRRTLRKQDDWQEWRLSEHEQLENYDRQGMFGEPIPPPADAPLFHWVWIYKMKDTPTETRRKTRVVCDGSPRAGQAVVTGHTYAATPDTTDLRVFCALSALEGKYIYGADVSNAFAEAPRCDQMYYMNVDQQFRDWWISKGRPPIPPGYVIPILKNLQGHPEAPRQWAIHVDKILQQYNFVPTTHAPCVYRATVDGVDVLFLRQVDDFAIATTRSDIYDRICDDLDSHLLTPMKRFGLLSHYNGIDILQTADYVTVHCGTYLTKVMERHGWAASFNPAPLPMNPDNSFVRNLDNAVPATPKELPELEAKLCPFRQAMGELIWPMITCRPEISFPVTKLCQFSNAPADVHFQAAKVIFRFLWGTKSEGITYWRRASLDGLPSIPISPLKSNPCDQTFQHAPPIDPFHLFGYTDSDWAMDTRHRRSISGIVFKLAGGAVSWRCRVQPTVALSSTEAEFLSASDAGRMALCLRSILDQLRVPQQYATVLYEDNRGALLLANAGQPTKHSRHIAIREYALLDWVERDLIAMESISTALNASDIVTKQLGRILFHRHWDNVSGRIIPTWSCGHTP